MTPRVSDATLHKLAAEYEANGLIVDAVSPDGEKVPVGPIVLDLRDARAAVVALRETLDRMICIGRTVARNAAADGAGDKWGMMTLGTQSEHADSTLAATADLVP
jgi:hypothetical protein